MNATEMIDYLNSRLDTVIIERDRLRESNAELVEALERLEQTAGIPASYDDPVRVAARAAIAKAKGEAK